MERLFFWTPTRRPKSESPLSSMVPGKKAKKDDDGEEIDGGDIVSKQSLTSF